MSLTNLLQFLTRRDVRVRLVYRPGPVRVPFAVAGLVALTFATWFWAPRGPRPTDYVAVDGPRLSVPQLPLAWPLSVVQGASRTTPGIFEAGNTFGAVLRNAGVDGNAAAAVLAAARTVIDVRRIRPGQRYELFFGEGNALTAMRYDLDRQNSWFLARDETGWKPSKVVVPVQKRPVFLSALIVDSLHRALAAEARTTRAVHDLTVTLADLYGWDIDFNYDLRYGDRVDMVVEERYVADEFIGYGDILAAEFRVGQRVLPIVRFSRENGSSYFAPDGTSLRRAFLRSPVKYQRISSRFSPRRVHPVTGIARAHRGVDYVADPGTPIQATADGVVVEARYSAEPGRYVKIRHGGSYSSIYMHLSRFHDGVKPGLAVKQGDIIGYVGKTGNATGYHLHYGLEQSGRFVDPVRIQFPAAAPIADEDRGAFELQRERWLRILRDGQSERAAVIAGGL